MSNDHPPVSALHQLVDGDSSVAETHVAECEECGGIVERLTEIKQRAARVPRAIEPPRDIWRRVADATRDTVPGRADITGSVSAKVSRLVPRSRNAWRVAPGFWRGAIAASLLVTVGAVAWSVRPNPDPAAAETNWPDGVDVPGVVVGDPQDQRLRTTLASRENFVSQRAAREINLQLAVLTEAADHLRAALLLDPNNVQLEAMLERTDRQKAAFVSSTVAMIGDF